MELTKQDSGGRAAARVGEAIVVTLPENPTTGYRWAADVDTAQLQLADDQFEGSTTPRGAGGTRRLTFTASGPGTVHLRLVKKRSWEKEGVEHFEVDLEVAP